MRNEKKVCEVNIGGFAGVNNGKGIIDGVQIAVNKELNGLNAKYQERMYHKKLIVTEVEDDTAKVGQDGNMRCYSKEFTPEQIDADNGQKPRSTLKDEQYTTKPNDSKYQWNKDGNMSDDYKTWNKNLHDENLKEHGRINGKISTSFLIGGLALGLGFIGLVALMLAVFR